MTVVTTLIIIALFATAGTLLSGVISMAHGGEFDRRHSHQLMFARVGLQAITLLLLLTALFAAAR